MKLTLHPGAESDVEEAAEFYEREGSAALAARFLEEFKRGSPCLSSTIRRSGPRDRRVAAAFQCACFPTP